MKFLLALTLTAPVAAIAVKPALLLSALKFAQPAITWDFPNAGNRIALTFDDGPDPVYTPQVLSILRDEGIPATFFLIGEQARRYPHLVAEIRNSGHEIGNHTMSGQATFPMPRKELVESLQETERLLQLQGAAAKWFRPASGWVRAEQVAAARAMGYTCVLGSSFAFDQIQPPAGLISAVIRHSLGPGGIIVMHDGGGVSRARSIAALPSIIRDARRRGFRFSRLSEMVRP